MNGAAGLTGQRDAAGRDLRVGEVADQVVREAAARQAAQQRDARHERRRPVEHAREHHVLDVSLIGAAVGGDVARQSEPELIVVDAEIPAHDGLRRDRPRRADARREVVLGFEFRVVLPAQSEIDASACRAVSNRPARRTPCSCSRRWISSSRGVSPPASASRYGPAVAAPNRSKSSVRRKQLILQQPRVGAIDLRAQEVHAELQIVAAEEPVGVGVELRVLLIEMLRRPQIAERDRRQVAEDQAVGGGAPRVIGIEER